MAVVYSWNFPSLEVVYRDSDHQSGGPFENVVTRVHWVCIASDGEFEASEYGAASLLPPGQSFTAYEDLTPEIVQGWVEAILGAEYVAIMRQRLADNIESQKNPTSGSMPPPWQA